MSIRLMAAVFEDELPSAEKLVLLALSDHADDAGKNCFPSIARIARKSSMTRRGVQKILRRLEAKGKIRPAGHRPSGTIEYEITLTMGERSSQGERTVFAGQGRTVFTEEANQSAPASECGSPESSTTTIQPPKEKIFCALPERQVKRATPFLDGFCLDPKMIIFARECGVDPQEEFAAFRDHHKARGNVFKDWEAAWRNWVRTAKRFGQTGTHAAAKGGSRAKERDCNNLRAAGLI